MRFLLPPWPPLGKLDKDDPRVRRREESPIRQISVLCHDRRMPTLCMRGHLPVGATAQTDILGLLGRPAGRQQLVGEGCGVIVVDQEMPARRRASRRLDGGCRKKLGGVAQRGADLVHREAVAGHEVVKARAAGQLAHDDFDRYARALDHRTPSHHMGVDGNAWKDFFRHTCTAPWVAGPPQAGGTDASLVHRSW